MRNLLNNFRVAKRNAVAMTILACVCMWGCGFEEETHNEWFGRDLKKIVGFLDDSLVIVGDVRRWHEVDDEDGDVVGLGAWGHHALYLYNYRVQEDGPKWMDSLDNGYDDDFEYFKGQLTDSVIWGSNDHVWSFWKVYDKPYKVTINEGYDGCSEAFRIVSVKQWFDNRFIALGDSSLKNFDGCQYAVLDTLEKKLIYKRLDGELEWISKCNDVKVKEGEIYCLALMDEPLNLYLIKDDFFLDSLLQGEPYGWNNRSGVSFMGDILNMGNNIGVININNKINGLGVRIVNDGSAPAALPRLSFKDDNAGEIKY